MLRKSQAARSFVATALVGATLLFTAAPSGASGLTTFAAAVHYAAGSAPQAMAVADVDKDGHADVVVVNGGASPGVSVLMGQADGSLGAPLSYSGGTSPTAVAVGDVNGDGYPDIVVVGNSSVATVRLNHGDGTFPDSGRSTYSFNFLLVTPAATWSSVAIADVNGDGRPDIVAANTTADLVSVLPGQVGGGFGFARQSQLNTAGGSTLTALALADINADGKVDVAVTDSKNNQLRSIAGAGDGTFSGGGTFAVGTHPTAVALADFNHDSKLDAAVTNSGSDSVSIFIQSGGTYLPAVNDAAGAGARALAVADLDADGNPDLAVAGQTANSVAVLRGRSDGTFFAALGYATGTNPVAVAATDLNGDTHPDLVTANSGSANVSVLLSVPAAVPGVPTITGASAGQAQATVTWTAPASDGGLPLTGYTVTSNPGNKTATVAGTATSATVGGLTNGTAYTFTLHATNAVGSGAESSPSAPVTPQQATVPGAPTGVVAARGDAQALVTWTVPASDGGSPITGYTVTVTPGGTTVDADVTGSGPATSALVGGLANGTSYTFTVHAANAVGAGTESAASNAVVPAAVPGAPAIVNAQAGDRAATITWTAPSSDGGSAITGYTVTSTPGGKTATVAGSATSATVTNLTNGISYTFTVHATNSVGNSLESAASNAVTPATPTAPGVPTAVFASPGQAQATVSWTAPTSDGGSAITGFTVTAAPGGKTAMTADGVTTSAIVTGLTNGTSYTFTVHATNAVGSSVESAASGAVVPAAAPAAPTGVSASRGNASATVAWTAPAGNGGSPVTGYVVTSTPGGKTATVTADATSAVVSGLTNGTSYTFTVHATSGVGDGTESVASNAVTPATVPDAPANVAGVRGDSQVTVSWATPAANGAALTGYTVTANPGGKTATVNGTAPSATVTGLTNGTAYTFTVHATNSVGDGPESASSAAVTPATVPDAPAIGTAVPGDTSATVSWTAPADGGSSITSFVVTASPGGQQATVDGAATSAVVTGLANGTTYTFKVHAVNAVGAGSDSAASNAVTPATNPGAPTAVSATRGNGEATVTWAAPGSGGATITGYVVTATPGGATATVNGAGTLSAVVTGLTNGTSYTFTVHATNTVGNGPESDPSNAVVPATIPGAPTVGTATAGNGSASITWTAPASNGGLAITGYTVTASPGGQTATVNGTATSAVVAGLTNGTSYTFTLHATNAVGNSPESSSTTAVVPMNVPGVPTGVTATRGNGSATVTWTAPADDGGSPITGYTVSSPEGGPTVSVTVNGSTFSATITGLANGSTYTFTVHATNAVGNGAESAPSAAVTPATTPGAPTGVIASRGDGAATVSWTAPSTDGGSAITRYTVTASPGGLHAITTSGSSAVVTGLTNGTAYTFTVHATNAVGNGPESAPSAAVTPATTPSAPKIGTAVAGNGSATVSWTAPTSNGGSSVTGYTVTSQPGSLTATVGPGATSATLTGLTNGTAYTFSVHARNAIGAGTESARSNAVTPVTVPGAPTVVSVDAHDGRVTVSWSAPASSGGAAITGYTVTAAPGGATATTDGTTHTADVTGLVNGTAYTFTVTATNSVGTGPASAASAAATPTADVVVVIATAEYGYWMLGSDGAVYGFGDATPLPGSLAPGSSTAVHIEPTPSANGYWIVDDLGHVSHFGDAGDFGSVNSSQLDRGEKVTSLSSTHSGNGYWIFTSRGRVLTFGDAVFHGDVSNLHLNGPVLGSIVTPSGNGYYMVASDGGIFALGDAAFYGSMGGTKLNKPVQSLVPTTSGLGYWLVASDGGVFSFGDAGFAGSMGGSSLNKPITGMVRTGHGYLMVGADGGIFDFSGTAGGFKGSLGDRPPANPITSVALLESS